MKLICLVQNRLKRLIRNLLFITREEGWQSYVMTSDENWTRVRLPSHEGFKHDFCADPFLFRHKGEDWLFYETTNLRGKGLIGVSKEVNGKWVHQGVALEEPCHLSYPQVFEDRGKVYMIPESYSRSPGDVSLYEAVDFPMRWRRVCQLIDRPFADCTVLKVCDHWYMACFQPWVDEHAELWHADSLFGPWKRHPMWDAINQSKRLRRCGGRFIERDGRIYRIAQDCNGFYGKRLFAVPVLEITPARYEVGCATMLKGKRNKPLGMKHTWNEIVADEGKKIVVDVRQDVFRPFGEIVRRFAAAMVNKLGIVWR